MLTEELIKRQKKERSALISEICNMGELKNINDLYRLKLLYKSLIEVIDNPKNYFKNLDNELKN